jgi:hypothetical protein
MNPHRVGRGTDANPTGMHANQRLGNSAARPSQRNLSRNDNARWDGRRTYGGQYSQNYRRAWNGNNGWNGGYASNGGYANWNRGYGGGYAYGGGYNGGWWGAPVGLSFGAGPAWRGSNECYEDLGYGRYESCDW